MALHYSNGVGRLYHKETGGTIADIKYQLVETDQTKYTPKKWWGEFSAGRKIKQLGDFMYIIEVEDGRKGECLISTNTERQGGQALQYYFRFYGRGKLNRRFSIGGF